MSTALFTAPIIGVLSWLTLVALGVWRFHGAIVERRKEAEKFRGRVLKDAEALDATLIEQLLDAGRPDDLLRTYLKDRAALVAGLALENPAAWQNDDLNDLVARRFNEEVQQERSRFWTFVIVSLAVALGAIFIVGAVLYHFNRDIAPTTNMMGPDVLPQFSVPQVVPPSDVGTQSSFNPPTPASSVQPPSPGGSGPSFPAAPDVTPAPERQGPSVDDQLTDYRRPSHSKAFHVS